MDRETADHIGALTGAFMELCNILAQRHVIDAQDLRAVHDIMHHRLRPRGGADVHAGSRELLGQWIVRAIDLAPDTLPLPPEG